MKQRLVDKFGQPISMNRAPDLSKKAFGLYSSIYEWPNAGRFRPRVYTNQDSSVGVSQYSRDLLLRWSREMVAQQPWVYSGIRTLSLFSVGSEYNPVYKGSQSQWGEIATQWLNEVFYPNCCSRGPNYPFTTLITILSEMIDQDGDILLLFGEQGGMPKVQMVPSHRVRSFGSSPFDPASATNPIPGPLPNTVVSDGVMYDQKTAAPIGYSILSKDNLVNASFSDSNGKVTFVTTKNARLIYQPRLPDLGRGIPTISSGILQALSVSEIEAYLVECIKIRSMYAAVEHAPEGEGPMEEEEAYRRSASSINALQGFSLASQPQDNASKGLRVVNTPGIKYVSAAPGVDIKFPQVSTTDKDTANQITRLETHVLGCLGVPHALLFSPDDVAGKMNENIIRMFQSSISKRQQLLDFHGKFIIGWALSKAIKNGDLPPNDEEILTSCFDFTHPETFTLDNIKTRQADLNDVNSGAMSLNEYARKRNTNAVAIQSEIETEQIAFFNSANRVAKETNTPVELVLQSMKEGLKQKSPMGGIPGV